MASGRRPAPIRPTFHDTTLTTLKLDEMVEFYEKVAGLEPVYYSEGGAWLTNDEANHRIALLALPGLKASEDKGTRSACTTPPSSTRASTSGSTTTCGSATRASRRS